MMKENLKRAIFNKNMMVAITISFISLVVGGQDSLFAYRGGVDFTYTYYTARSCGAASILALIYPLICILPYSRSYALEYNSGYIYYYNNKISKNKYLISKILSCFISGGIAIALPTMLFLLVCVWSNGFVGISIVSYITYNTQLFIQHPFLYCLLSVANTFLCGGIFALVGLFVSVFTKNTYLISVIPFGYYILGNIFFAAFNINLNPNLLFDINSYAESNALFVTIHKLVLLTISVIGFYFGGLCDAKK